MYTIRNCNKNTYIEGDPETKPFYFLYINILHARKNKDDLKDLEELEDRQSTVNQLRLVEKLGKQGYDYDIKELFEPIRKAVAASNQKLIEEIKSITKAIENLDETIKNGKTLESMNKNEIIHSNLIRPIAKLLGTKN